METDLDMARSASAVLAQPSGQPSTQVPSHQGDALLQPQARSAQAWADLRDGWKGWRISWLLGIGDVRRRYRRSKLGQFWITLSLMVFIGTIGFVYSALFQQPLKQYLPYLASSFIIWTFITGVLMDSTSAFVQSERILRQVAMPKSAIIFRILIKNYVALAHNLILIPIVLLICGIYPSRTWILSAISLVWIGFAGFWAAMILSILCTRFRDLPQLVQSMLQVIFFVTPVTWQPHFVGTRAYIVNVNPFAAFVRTFTEPMLGSIPTFSTYLIASLSTVLLMALALPLFIRFRARIVYWL